MIIIACQGLKGYLEYIMKKLQLFLLLLLGLSFSSVGLASPVNPDNYISGKSDEAVLTSNGGSAKNGNYTVAKSVKGSFSDVWGFKLNQNSRLSASTVANNLLTPLKIIDIEDGSLKFQLQKQNSSTSLWEIVLESIPANTSASYDSLTLGNYRFLVSGIGDGRGEKGSYGLNVQIYEPIQQIQGLTSTVPTPQTWILTIIGGIILLGFQMRRNSTTQESIRIVV